MPAFTLPRTHRRPPAAFTLVELLTVIAIIGILAAITLATVSRVRAQAVSARCGSNIRQLAALTAIWAQDNQDWVPQACWAWKTLPSYMSATNLRNVGYNDKVGTCGAVTDGVTFPPHYGVNSQLAAANFATDNTAYYVHGRYKFSSVLTSRTILFAETKWVSGWSFNATAVTDAAPDSGGRTGAYMAATNTFDARHSGKGYVAYTDGHIALKTQAQLNITNPDPWKQGITE
ncbi:prepilin-type N-terminal cleavage/methylation domain-containing protein [Opitutaceae bacterium TAV1]|nr:prepilin-type N-terminal cleavage/methylation domain-containing protein [Opitutaceae bacterium TAV1]